MPTVESDQRFLPIKAKAESLAGAIWLIHFPWGTYERIGGDAKAVKAWMDSEIKRRFPTGIEPPQRGD